MTASPAALHAAATAITQGNPAVKVTVSSVGVTVVAASELAGLRWRHHFGDTLAGLPLDVIAVTPVGAVG